MRSFGWTVAALFTMVSVLTAQPPGNNTIIPTPGTPNNVPVPVLNPNNRLDALLVQWEGRMKNVDSIWVKEITRTDKGSAMQQAQLELMKAYPHPYYWAPFQLLGDWQ